MKFAQISDVQIGYRQYGLAERAEDFANAWHWAVNKVIEEACDFLVFPGDLFQHRHVDPVTLNVAVDGLTKLALNGIPVYMVKGNHEISRISHQYDWLDYLAEQNLITLVGADPTTIKAMDGDKFVTLYGVDWAGYATNARVASLEITPDESFKILMLHAGLEDHMPRNYPGTISWDVLRSFLGTIDYVALAHIHKPYCDGWVHQPGSLETVAMDEYQWEDRGIYIVDTDTSQNFVEGWNVVKVVNSRRTFIIRDTLDEAAMEEIVEAGNGAVIHIREGTEADEQAILEVCEPLFLRVMPPIPPEQQAIVLSTETLSIDQVEMELISQLTPLSPLVILDLKSETEGDRIYEQAKTIERSNQVAADSHD